MKKNIILLLVLFCGFISCTAQELSPSDLFLYDSSSAAIKYGNDDSLRFIVQRSIFDPNKKNNDSSLLNQAVLYENKNAVHMLVDAGADTEGFDALGQTALHKAVIANSRFMVEVLLSVDANPYALDCYGNTPLHYAILRDDVSIVRALVLAEDRAMFVQNKNQLTPYDLISFCPEEKRKELEAIFYSAIERYTWLTYYRRSLNEC